MGIETKTAGDIAMDDSKKAERLAKKIECFLTRACVAEEKCDYFKAGRCFAMALLCEGRLLTDGKGAYAYVLSAMPVF